jgi:hypothetical protein
MKRIKTWSDYINENNEPSMDDLKNFYRDFMTGNTQIQKNSRNYKVDINQVRDMVKDIIYTPELLDELKKRKVEIPDISKLKFKIEKEKYHRCYIYELADNMTPDELGDIDQKFALSIDIKIPYDESFEDDNTLITAFIYIKHRGKLKGLTGHANKRAQKDNEFNSLSIGEVLQKAYNDLISNK